jgi:signal transduction histidine kinase
MKILCVDDEPRVLELLNDFLTENKFTVFTSLNGREALDVLKHNFIDIVLSDIRMPEMDGIDLLQKIKEDYPEIEVIILTGHGDMDLAISALRFGASNFINKPVDARELLQFIKNAAHKINLVKENRNYKENLEQLVKEQTEKLVNAEKMAVIGRHTAHLAHNLNSSLTSVLGSIQLIDLKYNAQENKVKDPKTLKYLKTAHDSALKMRDTISNTLQRIRKNAVIENISIDLNEVIKGQIEMFKTHTKVRNTVDFQLSLEKNLLPVLGVYSDFTQILDNLLTNSIDAIDSRIEKTIRIKTKNKEKSIVLEIEDNGTGIPESIREKIFNPHFTTKPIGKGTGIGLASVKELLKNYKAEISLKSDNNGTCFRIIIPTK